MKPLSEMAARRALNRSSTSLSDTALSTPLPVGTTVNAFTVTCAQAGKPCQKQRLPISHCQSRPRLGQTGHCPSSWEWKWRDSTGGGAFIVWVLA